MQKKVLWRNVYLWICCLLILVEKDCHCKSLKVIFGRKNLISEQWKFVDALEVKFAENQDLFDRLDEIKVDETLRPEKLKGDYNLGFYGSFKNIDFDWEDVHCLNML